MFLFLLYCLPEAVEFCHLQQVEEHFDVPTDCLAVEVVIHVPTILVSSVDTAHVLCILLHGHRAWHHLPLPATPSLQR